MFKRPEIETPRVDYPPAAPTEREPPQTRAAATIGATIRIKGDISGEESLTIEGTVEGTITVKQHTLHVGKNGRLNADVFAKTIRIEGQVEGNLHAEEQVLLRASGVVRGNISAPRLTMEDGCSFKGSVDMEPKAERRAAESSNPRPVAAAVDSQTGTSDRPAGMAAARVR